MNQDERAAAPGIAGSAARGMALEPRVDIDRNAGVEGAVGAAEDVDVPGLSHTIK